MSEVKGVLTGVGVSTTFRATSAATIRYYLNGVYSGTVFLQRATTGDETTWETVKSGGGPFLGAGDVSGIYTVTAADSLRWYMSTWTSGSATYLLTDEAAPTSDPNAVVETTAGVGATTNDLLTDILTELRVGNLVLNEVADTNIDLDDARASELEEIA